MFNKRLIFAITFALYMLIWSFANWPALKQAWWCADDFIRAEDLSGSLPRGLENGRPLEGLWFWTFALDGRSDHELQNMALRLLQGGLHSLTATIAAYLLWQHTLRKTTVLAVLPFLLWPFNQEAVLWRSAGAYTVAAMLGLLGLWAIRQEGYWLKGLGVVAIILGSWANQVAVLSGLIVWVILVSLDSPQSHSLTRVKQEITLFLLGYVVGGVSSYIIARSFYPSQRTTFGLDYKIKLHYLFDLNQILLVYPDNYPQWLAGLHVLLFMATISILIWQHRLLPLLALTLLLVIPYLPLLLVKENNLAWRVMYLAPFVIVAAWSLLEQAIGSQRIGLLLAGGLLSLILVSYIKIGRANAHEYVQIFTADLATLHQIEVEAKQREISMIFVATHPDFVRGWNPYSLRYISSDSKLSAFQISWMAHPFIRWFSPLQPIDRNEAIKNQCVAQCQLTKDKPYFQYDKLPNEPILCICP
jgi:hypothetical protein